MRFPLGETFKSVFEEQNTLIGRCIVNKNELYIVKGLVEKTFCAPHNMLFDIIYGNNYGYLIHKTKRTFY